jgi:putative membrane protein
LYAAGVSRLWREAGTSHGIERWRLGCFAAGWVVLAAALLPPIDALAAQLFSAHMLQHELLMLAAAPLLVLARTLSVWLWAFPPARRRALRRVFGQRWLTVPWGWLTRPFVAWLLHAAALWLWHLPSLFNAALRDEGIHALQHASFYFTACFFWWALLRGRTARSQGAAIAYLFTTMIHTGALGALLVFSPRIWYPVYGERALSWGLTALEDQQLGGLIMWLPGGLIYVAACLALVANWLGAGRVYSGQGKTVAGG